MPRTTTKSDTDQIEALNSDLKFCTVVQNLKDEKGRPILDYDHKPQDRKFVRAELYNKADGKQWCAAEGGDEPDALRNLLEKARETSRPASTAQDVIKERDELKERMAAMETELARVKRGTAVAAPGESQIRRTPLKPAEPAADPALSPRPQVAAAAEGESGSENTTDIVEFQGLLKAAGISFDGRWGVAKLRDTCLRHNLIPSGV